MDKEKLKEVLSASGCFWIAVVVGAGALILAYC